jgi:hypothetical protein
MMSHSGEASDAASLDQEARLAGEPCREKKQYCENAATGSPAPMAFPSDARSEQRARRH